MNLAPVLIFILSRNGISSGGLNFHFTSECFHISFSSLSLSLFNNDDETSRLEEDSYSWETSLLLLLILFLFFDQPSSSCQLLLLILDNNNFPGWTANAVVEEVDKRDTTNISPMNNMDVVDPNGGVSE